MSCDPRPQTIEFRRNFKRADYIAINDYLGSISWDDELKCRNVYEAIDFLYYHLNYVIVTYVPLYTVKKSMYPVWFSAELISLTKAKKLAHFNYKNSYRYSDYLLFNQLRTRCKLLSSICWKNYTSKSERAISENVKSFWSFTNSLRGINHLPTHIYHNNSVIDDDSMIANCFANFFESVYVSNVETDFAVDCESVIDISNIDISISEVFERITKLQLNSLAGTDNIPPLFFVSCKFIMSRVLWTIFNKSLSCGVFPDTWKRSIVTPIFKSGDKTLVSNYRPISKQNVMPKIFENSLPAGCLLYARTYL